MPINILTGYINYRNEKHIFIIDNYEIKLIPCDQDVLNANKVTKIFDSITTKKNKKGFINNVVLEGICLNGKNISICIQDCPWINNGVFSYKVIWIYIYNNEISKKDIKGLNFLSQEINYFYDTKQYIKDDYKLKEGKFNNYTVSIKSKKRDYLGLFKYNQNIIKIYGDMAWKKNYDVSNNLEIWSKLSLEFENEIQEIDEIYKIVLLQKIVIDILTYRTNNGFDAIEVYTYNKNERREVIGSFYICDEYTKEANYKDVKHLITSNNISDIGKLYELIMENKVYTSHICGSHKLATIYNPPRMLGILIAFERIINWKYDKEEFRNDDYIELLNRINNLVQSNKEILCDGLSKNKIRFNKTVEFAFKPQIPFSAYIIKVISEYPVTLSIISKIYGENVTKELITEISERINQLRNDMAHGNMDIEFNDINTKDVKFMELLYYGLILKELGLSDDETINKIAWLFNINPFMR